MNEYVVFITVIVVIAYGGLGYWFGYSEGEEKRDEDIEKMLNKAIRRAKEEKQ